MKIKKIAPYVVILAGLGLGMYGCKEKEPEPIEEPPIVKPIEKPPVVKPGKTTYDEQGFAINIRMENPAYEKHTKGIIMFSHKKHFEEYNISCGECHHDENNKPLELKIGDSVQSCIECHTIPEKWKKSSGKDKLDYHANALHQNCTSCHKEYNKEIGEKKAPTTCGKCHPKRK